MKKFLFQFLQLSICAFMCAFAWVFWDTLSKDQKENLQEKAAQAEDSLASDILEAWQKNTEGFDSALKAKATSKSEELQQRLAEKAEVSIRNSARDLLLNAAESVTVKKTLVEQTK